MFGRRYLFVLHKLEHAFTAIRRISENQEVLLAELRGLQLQMDELIRQREVKARARRAAARNN